MHRCDPSSGRRRWGVWRRRWRRGWRHALPPAGARTRDGAAARRLTRARLVLDPRGRVRDGICGGRLRLDKLGDASNALPNGFRTLLATPEGVRAGGGGGALASICAASVGSRQWQELTREGVFKFGFEGRASRTLEGGVADARDVYHLGQVAVGVDRRAEGRRAAAALLLEHLEERRRHREGLAGRAARGELWRSFR